MSDIFSIGGREVDPGEIREIHLPITEAANSSPILVPLTIIRGRESGPKIFLTAAVHGDELNGTSILRTLLNQITPDKIKGTLVVAPIVNMLGFLARSRYLPDRRDLNRNFPGSADGSTAQRVAYQLFLEVVSKCNMGVDFHTAAEGRDNFPHIRADMKDPSVRKLAKAFGLSVIIDDPGVKGTLRRAASKRKIPTLLFEGGTPDTFQKPVVNAGLNGTLTFLHKIGVLKQLRERAKPPFQIIARRMQWVRAERGGLLELKVAPGTVVYRGDSIAVISNPLGREVHSLITPITGLVIGLTTSPVVNPGTPIAHLVELQKTLKTVEKHTKNGKLSF